MAPPSEILRLHYVDITVLLFAYKDQEDCRTIKTTKSQLVDKVYSVIYVWMEVIGWSFHLCSI